MSTKSAFLSMKICFDFLRGVVPLGVESLISKYISYLSGPIGTMPDSIESKTNQLLLPIL